MKFNLIQFNLNLINYRKRDGSLLRVHECHQYYDALQYPLIYWAGQTGYHFHIPIYDVRNSTFDYNNKVSAKDFYSYRFMLREDEQNMFLHYKELTKQFFVDMYAKIETERLRWITLNQKTLRSEELIHLQDAIDADPEVDGKELGRRVILPSSFINSPRYLAQYVQDAFGYIRILGHPDLFITMTCNPQWKEITDELKPNERPLDRQDIIARVFRQKVKRLVKVIQNGTIFGENMAYMYSIEWQKRGLPHVHLLTWLKNKIRPDQVDKIISAEIPDKTIDPILHEIVVKNMIHGPCGKLNPNSPCMHDGECSKKYPRQLLKETLTNDNGYPLYRRRGPTDGGFIAEIKWKNNQMLTVDNRWVVPHSPILSRMFKAHINVEYCCSVKAIKYICKYINKGSDQAVFTLHRDGEDTENINEVDRYQFGRYINSNEAVWRIFAFKMHERHPTVQHLSVHLENGQRIYFDVRNLHAQLENVKKTTLTAFFELCTRDDFAKTLKYIDVPRYYTWETVTRKWQRRKRGTDVDNWIGVKECFAVGRLYTVHIGNFECFCLRLLLLKQTGPTSYNDLKVVNGRQYESFSEACEALGLLENNEHWKETMNEAVMTRTPHKIRQLFAILLTFCEITNPKDLWEAFKEPMSEDILYKQKIQAMENRMNFSERIFNEALKKIDNSIFAMTGKHLKDYGMPQPDETLSINSEIVQEMNYNVEELTNKVEATIPMLNKEQREFFEKIKNQLANNEGGVFCLQAHGGTGKSFLLNLILAEVRKRGQIALAVASSGIAATLLSGGRTAHSVLKLPLNIREIENPTCNISKNTEKAELLRECVLIEWDEFTMAHKSNFEAVDRTLRDLRNNDRIMGGMVVILSGDFRQILPVIPRGTAGDEIQASIKNSYLWPQIEKYELIENMRIRLNENEQSQFPEKLLEIGDGRLEMDEEGLVRFPENFCNFVENRNELIDAVFPNIEENYSKEDWLCERAILASTNEIVDIINREILNKMPGEERTFESIDTVINEDDTVHYPTEVLNSLEFSGVPSHKLYLKVGAPILLLRNLHPPGLCNGTRLKITNMSNYTISAVILSGPKKGEEVVIPRIPMEPTDVPFRFKRIQFPVKLAFVITINKAQGQTLEVAGIDLEKNCFSHGQLYVACSRVRSQENMFILAKNRKTKNVVYKRALE